MNGIWSNVFPTWWKCIHSRLWRNKCVSYIAVWIQVPCRYHRPNKAIRRKIDALLELMTLKEPTRLYIDHILKRQTQLSGEIVQKGEGTCCCDRVKGHYSFLRKGERALSSNNLLHSQKRQRFHTQKRCLILSCRRRNPIDIRLQHALCILWIV